MKLRLSEVGVVWSVRVFLWVNINNYKYIHFFIHLLQFVFFVQIYAEVSVMPGFRPGHLVKLWLTVAF